MKRLYGGVLLLMAGIAAVNAIVLIIYDLSLSDSLSGRLVGAVGLALMPVFLSGLSDRMGKVSTVATAAVAFSVILSFLLRGRAGLWLLPMLSLLSASLVIAESVLFSRNDSPRVYTSSELQVVNIRTNVIYFLVFVLLLMTGAYIGDTDGFASDLSVCLCLMFLILLFNAMYGRMVNHRLFFFLKEYERKLIETADACTFSACEAISVEDKGYHAIFERLKRLFEEEKFSKRCCLILNRIVTIFIRLKTDEKNFDFMDYPVGLRIADRHGMGPYRTRCHCLYCRV